PGPASGIARLGGGGRFIRRLPRHTAYRSGPKPAREAQMMKAERERQGRVEQVFEYMRARKLSLDDLIEIGGEDLRSPKPAIVSRARAVERCWELLARLGLKYADLAHSEAEDGPTTGLAA